MYSFPNFETVFCSMSSSNCCFLTCIQVLQEASKVVWYSHFFKNFPWFVVIHTVKAIRVVNGADVFLEFSRFFYGPTDIGSLICGSSVFSKSSLYIWKFLVHLLLKPGLKDFKHYLLACEMSAIVQKFEHSLALPLFGTGMKTDLFQSSGHCWLFQMCGHIECSTLTTSSFRIWNRSAGIPSPPLALLIVILPKTYLT